MVLTHGNVIFDILEPLAFQKYSICWVFREFFCSTIFYMYFATRPIPALTAVALSVCFQMCPQSAGIGSCKVTLRGCIITFVAFDRLSPSDSVCFQMCPHSAGIGSCKVILVALGLVFLHYVFSNVPSICLPKGMHNHTVCIYLTFLQCVFSNVSLNA